jgi:thiamine-phosphate pyrophosphorylase
MRMLFRPREPVFPVIRSLEAPGSIRATRKTASYFAFGELLNTLITMLLYAITDRRQLPGSDPGRLTALINLARAWAQHSVDYIQIREKDLAPRDLLDLTAKVVSAVRNENQTTRVLLNGPAQIALDVHADGVHLPAGAASNAAEQTRNLFASSGRDAILSHSCHSIHEVLKAKEESQRNPLATVTSTLNLYAPVFEKSLSGETPLPGLGLESLRAAAEAARPIPVFALGGVTLQNAPSCLAAGAAGIAAIRLFLKEDWLSLMPR